MIQIKRTPPILKKSNFHVSLASIILILVILPVLNCFLSYAQELRPQKKIENIIEAIISPEVVHVGDTVSIKIKKTGDEPQLPKVYFDKSKIPIFKINEKLYRGLIPLSADYKAKKYPIEIFYNGQTKKIDLAVEETKYPIQELTLTKEVVALKATRIEKALVAKALKVVSNEKIWQGKFTMPSSGRHSTPYGVQRRVNGVITPGYFHRGLDFAAPQGSDIKAPENGKVILTGHVSKGFVVNGNCIFIDHGHGVITGYLHLQNVLVKEGDLVKKGQIIGKVGGTGIASGPHLHWGVYVLGKTVDPINWTKTAYE